ncbi:hypothetical protein BJF78_20875 [Pseudonocardia sp. CNS-139]|nr:hypothetical protein BJF78_20875 [Pseudonocardia sp. CNS-139]
MDAEISILVTDRDAALAQAVQLARDLDEARMRAEKLRAQVRTLASPQQSAQTTSERIRTMLRLAEDEVSEMLGRAETEANRRTREADEQAAETLATAREEAERIRAEATAEAERMRSEIAQSRDTFAAEREAAERKFTAERETAEREHAALVAAAAQERAESWAASEARRTEVEEDFTIAMDQRRSETLAELAAQREATRAELDELRTAAERAARETVAQAETHAQKVVSAAEQRTAELLAARQHIAEQLVVTRSVLDETIGTLGDITVVPPPATRDGALDTQDALGAQEPDGAAHHNGADPALRRPTPRPRARAAPATDHRTSGHPPTAAARTDQPDRAGLLTPPARPAPPARLPARHVPVPAVGHGAELVGRPGHQVPGAGRDELVAARTPVVLRGGRAGHAAHDPVAVRPDLPAGERGRPQRHVVRPPGPVGAGHVGGTRQRAA